MASQMSFLLLAAALIAGLGAASARARPPAGAVSPECAACIGEGPTLRAPMSPYDPNDPLLPCDLRECGTGPVLR